MAKDYARKRIDPSRVVGADDLLQEFAEWHGRLFARFAQPDAKSGNSKKAANPVKSTEGHWMEYISDEKIKCYWRVSRKSLDLWEELACLRNGAQYTDERPEGHIEPLTLLPPASGKGKGKGKGKKSSGGRRSS